MVFYLDSIEVGHWVDEMALWMESKTVEYWVSVLVVN
jgi:hypothetical protein